MHTSCRLSRAIGIASPASEGLQHAHQQLPVPPPRNYRSFHQPLRRSALLLTLAALTVLAGATLALIPHPAQADHVVSRTTLTVQVLTASASGCDNSGNINDYCSKVLSQDELALRGGSSITVHEVRVEIVSGGTDSFRFGATSNLPADITHYAIVIGNHEFRFDTVSSSPRPDTRKWDRSDLTGIFPAGNRGLTVEILLVDTRVTHPPPAIDEAEIGRSFPKAQPKTAWSATLRVGDTFQNAIYGCNDGGDAHLCSTALTDRDFTYDGDTYVVESITVNHGYANALSFSLVQDISPEMRNKLRLIVNGKSYHLTNNRSAGGQVVSWASGKHGQVWAVGDRIRVKLVERDFPTLTAQEFDHNVERIPARPPAGTPPPQTSVSAANDYCYTGDGTGSTTMIRYPNGRIAEVPDPGKTTRSMFACN